MVAIKELRTVPVPFPCQRNDVAGLECPSVANGPYLVGRGVLARQGPGPISCR